MDYQRSSIIFMMIEHPMYMFNDEIARAFRQIPVPERFNDHGLGVKVVKFATQEFSDQTSYIDSFIRQSRLGSRAVAKWFSWDKATGKFNMSLIQERGYYNATELDRELAAANIRGMAVLADAGENLIPDTYLIMNDICYTGSYSNKEREQHTVGQRHAFSVTITSYIYQLDWDEEALYDFYYTCYDGKTDFVNEATKYGFTFRAKVETEYSESDNRISQLALIERVVARCLDINLVKLQRAYPDFRVKSLVRSGDPFLADVGMKEGVTVDCLFEVLEQSEDEHGVRHFERVGLVRPIKGRIWDNRYGIEPDSLANAPKFTEFEVVKGSDFYPGMLIRELEGK